MEKLKLKQGLIIINNQEEEIIEGNKKIIVKPAWKWLLNV